MTPRRCLILAILLPLAGAALGRAAGPHMARANYTVSLAETVRAEADLPPGKRSDQTEAFRATGAAQEDLFRRAAQLERRFLTGGALLGAWCGLVVGVKLLSLTIMPRRKFYEINHARCVTCGRCYRYCPRERLRLKRLHEADPAGGPED